MLTLYPSFSLLRPLPWTVGALCDTLLVPEPIICSLEPQLATPENSWE